MFLAFFEEAFSVSHMAERASVSGEWSACERWHVFVHARRLQHYGGRDLEGVRGSMLL